jgi:hypothetical protein
MKSRKCARCKKRLPATLEYFYKHSRNKNILGSWCKECTKQATNERRRANPGTARLAERQRYVKRNYGITLDDYDRMAEEQGGVCAICGEPDITGRRLAIDHNHETGEVRGLLCVKCNVKLGVLESTRWRKLAESYIKHHDN